MAGLQTSDERGTARGWVIGAGLAGAEAAWQMAERGVRVALHEMRPGHSTPAHRTGDAAELVCSNSLGSMLEDRGTGVLLREMRRLGSLIVREAEAHRVPAGGALAVDREAFARSVTRRLREHPNIAWVEKEVVEIPRGLGVVASGPLTSDRLAADIQRLTGEKSLYFYDALAPIVEAGSLDGTVVFAASRRSGDGEGDYLNCPLNREEYLRFVEALLAAGRAPLKDFEQEGAPYFEGCLPIEVLAARGPETLAFGPMRPVGLTDPRTGRQPHAVVQLRRDNAAGTLFNLVGFQTNLQWGEQERVLRMIPGLARAEFVRLGQMHRNTFLNSPRLLEMTMEFRAREGLFFAGQMTGAEGYLGNAATGLLAGWNAARRARGGELLVLPQTTMLGALAWYLRHAEAEHFQPMKANFGLMPALENPPRDKRARGAAYSARAAADLEAWIAGLDEALREGGPR